MRCGSGDGQQKEVSHMVPKRVHKSASLVILCSFLAPLPRLCQPCPSGLSGRAMTTNIPWLELEWMIDTLTGQVHRVERVGSLEQVTRWIQEVVHNVSQRQGSGGRPPADRTGSNALVGRNIVPEGFAIKRGFEQWGWRSKLVARVKCERSNTLLDCADAWEMNAHNIAPESTAVARRVSRNTSTQVCS